MTRRRFLWVVVGGVLLSPQKVAAASGYEDALKGILTLAGTVSDEFSEEALPESLFFEKRSGLPKITRTDKKVLKKNIWEKARELEGDPEVATHLEQVWGVGGDAEDQSIPQNRQHIEDCPDCKRTFDDLIRNANLRLATSLPGFGETIHVIDAEPHERSQVFGP